MIGNTNHVGFTTTPGVFRKCVCCGKKFEIHSANHVRCNFCKKIGRKVPKD